VYELEEREIMAFKDEDGNKVEFEVIAKIYLEETEYLILAPVDGNEEDAFAFRVDYEDEDKPIYNLVEDDKEFEAIKKEYKNLLYNKE
jgi:uncharacterized protein YrzB (UPF0473 family)